MSKIEFQGGGTFEAMYAAQHFLKENGYDYGSTCAMMPVAVVKGHYHEDYDLPEKWKNFTAKQKKSVHGTITGDMREGPVTVTFFDGFKPEHTVVLI
jgi:hypothetical protein